MNYRKKLEQHESIWLHPKASRSMDSKGRMYSEEKSPFRSEFMRDRDRIIHSKAFRRLLYKTQVFISPENDHFRTRSIHTLEVMQIATAIASVIQLNRDLVEAISLGHDLGHSPFGHIGEAILNDLYHSMQSNGSFYHAEFSMRIVDELEHREEKQGLNLTWETRDGILHHSKGLRSLFDHPDQFSLPGTLEGQLVRIVDRIGYISHDFDDSLRGNFFTWEQVPKDIYPLFSQGTSFVINFFSTDLIKNFKKRETIELSKKVLLVLESAKSFLTTNVYCHPTFLPLRKIAKGILLDLFQFYFDHPESMQSDFDINWKEMNYQKWVKIRKIIDYLAGMTDRFAISQYESIFRKRILWTSSNI